MSRKTRPSSVPRFELGPRFSFGCRGRCSSPRKLRLRRWPIVPLLSCKHDFSFSHTVTQVDWSKSKAAFCCPAPMKTSRSSSCVYGFSSYHAIDANSRWFLAEQIGAQDC